ncbi:unnamed protein product [Paramecium pentaurelia]|uniref:Ankyrin repeat protein n=1 Tax=Paramecium pentaurelia TaxID=43138 RepID=A0A8S1SGH9_9CILI|nr:unnamed protein product [Paramecium pentaurelia]
MGNYIVKGLYAIGVPETTIKYFSQTTQDKIANAIINGDLDLLQQIAQSTNYNFTSIFQGENSLMLAVRMNQLAIVKYIINSTDENQLTTLLEDKNPQGDTSLMIATINQNIEIIQYLISVGAKVNTKENGGASIFIAACASGNIELVQVLFNIPGINIYLKNNEGQTAIHRACYYGEIEIVRFLLKNTKLSLLSKDKMGNNCFHLAAKHFYMTLIRYMLKKFRKHNQVLKITNGDNQSTLDILVELFNKIKDESYAIVDINQIEDYIKNKDMPPEINQWTHKQREMQKKQIPRNTGNKKRKTVLYKQNLKLS